MVSLWNMLIDRIPLAREYLTFIKPAKDISAIKHVQLLQMTHERLVYSFSAMPWVATFALFFYCQQRLRPMARQVYWAGVLLLPAR